MMKEGVKLSYVVHEPVGEVKFLRKYYPLIRDGVKTQTLRLARKRLDVREGDIVSAIFPGSEDVLNIKILKIGYKQFKSLTLDDAKREGYNCLAALKNDLYKIYPMINQFDRLYYYQFMVI